MHENMKKTPSKVAYNRPNFFSVLPRQLKNPYSFFNVSYTWYHSFLLVYFEIEREFLSARYWNCTTLQIKVFIWKIIVWWHDQLKIYKSPSAQPYKLTTYLVIMDFLWKYKLGMVSNIARYIGLQFLVNDYDMCAWLKADSFWRHSSLKIYCCVERRRFHEKKSIGSG